MREGKKRKLSDVLFLVLQHNPELRRKYINYRLTEALKSFCYSRWKSMPGEARIRAIYKQDRVVVFVYPIYLATALQSLKSDILLAWKAEAEKLRITLPDKIIIKPIA